MTNGIAAPVLTAWIASACAGSNDWRQRIARGNSPATLELTRQTDTWVGTTAGRTFHAAARTTDAMWDLTIP
jgi:hypothetical protein